MKRYKTMEADIKMLADTVLYLHKFPYGISTKPGEHYNCTCQACEVARKYMEKAND